ncbi:LOW QUALITY PROTEIN: hypothetical protein SETIT_7G326100v2 [Setaria italica]|uniref:FAF domain-containing protein n=2 Tax=Setaria italica TaxID=4555 RepID=A0A368S2C3_SETIT|nr:LOW QUALITY PROTEIN: hypothetical protein SETIT_7G326100v2 [Setaria italica]
MPSTTSTRCASQPGRPAGSPLRGAQNLSRPELSALEHLLLLLDGEPLGLRRAMLATSSLLGSWNTFRTISLARVLAAESSAAWPSSMVADGRTLGVDGSEAPKTSPPSPRDATPSTTGALAPRRHAVAGEPDAAGGTVAWNHPIPKQPIDPASFTEILGELHFQERQPERAVLLQPAAAPRPASCGSTSPPPPRPRRARAQTGEHRGHIEEEREVVPVCLKKSSASLLLCTESTVDADDMLKDMEPDSSFLESTGSGSVVEEGKGGEAAADVPAAADTVDRARRDEASFWADGRLVLMEVVMPVKELLQAAPDGGRLRLQFVTPPPQLVLWASTRTKTATIY